MVWSHISIDLIITSRHFPYINRSDTVVFAFSLLPWQRDHCVVFLLPHQRDSIAYNNFLQTIQDWWTQLWRPVGPWSAAWPGNGRKTEQLKSCCVCWGKEARRQTESNGKVCGHSPTEQSCRTGCCSGLMKLELLRVHCFWLSTVMLVDMKVTRPSLVHQNCTLRKLMTVSGIPGFDTRFENKNFSNHFDSAFLCYSSWWSPTSISDFGISPFQYLIKFPDFNTILTPTYIWWLESQSYVRVTAKVNRISYVFRILSRFGGSRFLHVFRFLHALYAFVHSDRFHASSVCQWR